MKFNPSLIKTWMNCPMQAKFRYLDGLPEVGKSGAAEFGTIIHKVLEFYEANNRDIEGARELFHELWELFLADKEVTLPPRMTFGKYHTSGMKMLEEYHENRQWVNETILAQEHRFCVPFGKHEISGIVDLLMVNEPSDKADGYVNVVDYKTGYRPNADNLHLDIQFTSYLWAASRREFWVGVEGSDKYVGLENGDELFETYGSAEKRGIWFDLRKGKGYSVGPRGTADMVRLHRCLDQIELAIKNETFVPNISGDTCKWCSYKDNCTVYLSEDEVGKDIEL